MTEAVDPDARAAWRAGMSLNGMLVVVIIGSFLTHPAPRWSGLAIGRTIALGLCLAWLVVLLRDQERPRLGVSLAAFGLAALPLLVLDLLFGKWRIAAGLPFEPFIREKTLFLVLAILSPRQLWVGGSVIVAFAIEICVERWVVGIGRSAGPYEPWVTLAVAAWAIWLARLRALQLTRERALRRRLRESSEAGRMAKVALAVRDLANTPLQVIELQLTLLEAHHEPTPSEVVTIRRALARLAELNRILASYEQSDASRSFDAEAVLEDSGPPPSVDEVFLAVA